MTTPTPSELLPWYLNGTLTDAEIAQVEEWLNQADRDPELDEAAAAILAARAHPPIELLIAHADRSVAPSPGPPVELEPVLLQHLDRCELCRETLRAASEPRLGSTEAEAAANALPDEPKPAQASIVPITTQQDDPAAPVSEPRDPRSDWSTWAAAAAVLTLIGSGFVLSRMNQDVRDLESQLAERDAQLRTAERVLERDQLTRAELEQAVTDLENELLTQSESKARAESNDRQGDRQSASAARKARSRLAGVVALFPAALTRSGEPVEPDAPLTLDQGQVKKGEVKRGEALLLALHTDLLLSGELVVTIEQEGERAATLPGLRRNQLGQVVVEIDPSALSGRLELVLRRSPDAPALERYTVALP